MICPNKEHAGRRMCQAPEPMLAETVHSPSGIVTWLFVLGFQEHSDSI